VQTLLSLQVLSAGMQAPVSGLQVSSVQAKLSLQFFGE